MAKGSDNEFPKIILDEQASPPATPAAGTQKLFIDVADHKLKRVDENDDVTEIEGALDIGALDEKTAPVTGDMFVLSDSEDGGALKKVDADNLPGDGGGVTLDQADPYGIHHRLDTPDADDDEFSDGSIAVAWTQVNPTGTVTWVEANGVLSAVFSGQSASDVGAILKATTLADGEAFETTLQTLVKKLTDYTMAGMIITDGTTSTSNAMALLVYQTSAADELVFEVRTGTLTNMGTSATAFIASNGSMNGKLRLRILRNSATSFSPRVSTEAGAQFTTFGMGNVNPGFTPTHAGLFVTVWGGANSGVAAFDYLRVIPP